MTAALQSQIEEVCRLAVKHDLDEATRDIIRYSIVQSAAYFMPRAWTVEELRTLPIGTLVTDADGTSWLQTEHGFQIPQPGGQQHNLDGAGVLAEYPPQHITHLPEEN